MRGTYPQGTKYGDYFVAKEAEKHVIKRMLKLPNGRRTASRLSVKRYKDIKDVKSLQDFVIRLNGRENRRAIQEIKTKLAFLPTSLMEEFRETLSAEIPNEKDAKLHYRNLHRYFLGFFVDKCALKDPVQWKANETKWGLALMSDLSPADRHLALYEDNKRRSVKTIKGIIHTANRFMAFLHKKQPQEISFIKFSPISKARLKDYKAKMELDTEAPGKYISDKDWIKIQESLPGDIAPFVELGYYYGLRRAETLAIKLSDISKGHLNVRRQIQTIGKPIPLKNRLNRKTPHWFVRPENTHRIVTESIKIEMHPDTLGAKFAAYMKALSMDYELHDLRRTFITKALELHNGNAIPVMFAVGHASSEVTMRYLRDNRVLDDELFSIVEDTFDF